MLFKLFFIISLTLSSFTLVYAEENPSKVNVVYKPIRVACFKGGEPLGGCRVTFKTSEGEGNYTSSCTTRDSGSCTVELRCCKDDGTTFTWYVRAVSTWGIKLGGSVYTSCYNPDCGQTDYKRIDY